MSIRASIQTTDPANRLGRRLGRWLAGKLGLSRQKLKFTDSESYWDQRYRLGGSSGAGSYGRLARFKAEFLNGFLNDHQITSVVEFGSGDGAQLALADYPNYVGVDVSPTAIAHCRQLYHDRPQYEFLHSSEVPPDLRAELALSLDVIYHLVEDPVFEQYMNQLFDAGSRFVIVYSSNYDERPVPHVRNRKFTDWVSDHRPEFRLTHHQPNPYPFDPDQPSTTSFADFYVFERIAE